MSDYQLKHGRLAPGEVILDTWVASLASKAGRMAKYGGTLVLTNQRLIWDPIKVPGAIRIAGPRGVFRKDVIAWDLDEVGGIEADPKRGALVHLDTPDGRIPFLILAARMATIWSKKNREFRDAAVAGISAALRA